MSSAKRLFASTRPRASASTSGASFRSSRTSTGCGVDTVKVAAGGRELAQPNREPERRTPAHRSCRRRIIVRLLELSEPARRARPPGSTAAHPVREEAAHDYERYLEGRTPRRLAEHGNLA